MSFPVVYDRAGPVPSGGPQPGAVAMLTWALANFAECWSGGIYNPRVIAGTNVPSVHAEGRAVDVMFPVRNGAAHPEGSRLAETLERHHAAFGVQQIIWNRRLWRNTSTGWQTYGGKNPHIDHVHFELTREAAKSLTPAMIRAVDPDEEFLMSLMVRIAAGRALIFDAYDQIAGRRPDGDGLKFWYTEVDTAARADTERDDKWDSEMQGVVARCEAMLRAEAGGGA